VPHVTEADRQHDLVQILRKFTDLREPHLWFPVARDMKRKIVIHAGPTNSGKTYHALQQLMQAESGTYCAPLR
jgi:ATP-dependent RNA helicase SUPV3L1/SUV3